MFDGFADVWTPLIEIRRLRQAPVRIELAGEGLVAFRGSKGEVGVLLDRCPHRSARLSLGRIDSEGCLECPFHGWRFAVDGTNRRVPLNPEARRHELSAAALPVRLLGDLVWVYTRPGGVPAAEPVVADGLVAPGLARTYLWREWRCHWTRVMENMLDTPHLPFVHRRTIGRTLRRQMRPDSVMEIEWEDRSWGGRAMSRLDGVDGGGVLEYYRPNIMALTIPIPGQHFRIHALVIPAGLDQTRLLVVGSRNFLRMRIFDGLFRWSNGRIADEDRAVVESSPAGAIPLGGQERSVPTDRATLQFRRYYNEVLRHTSV